MGIWAKLGTVLVFISLGYDHFVLCLGSVEGPLCIRGMLYGCVYFFLWFFRSCLFLFQCVEGKPETILKDLWMVYIRVC